MKTVGQGMSSMIEKEVMVAVKTVGQGMSSMIKKEAMVAD